jgi:hypothetical protein
MSSFMQHVRQQEQHCKSSQLNCYHNHHLSAAAAAAAAVRAAAAVLRTNIHSRSTRQAAGSLEVAAVAAVAVNVVTLAR